MINKDAKLTFDHLSKDLQKAYLECKENNYFYCINCGDIWYPGEKLTYAGSLVCFHFN